MNKIIVIFATLFFASGAYASKECNANSLTGEAFSYEVSGVNQFPLPPGGTLVTRSTHVVGLVSFDKNGDIHFTGTGSAAGVVRSKIGVGRYQISDSCVVTGFVNWVPADEPSNFSTFTVVLDQFNATKKPFIALHGVVLATDVDVASSSGSLTRRSFSKGQSN